MVPVSPLLLLALLFAGRPGVTADATCNVPPVNLTSALVDDNASVVLNWEASGECVPDEYAVYRRDMDLEGSRMTRIAGVDGDVLTYTDTTVNSGEVYRYRIRSNNIGRRSDVTEITIPEASVNQPEPEPEPETIQRTTRQDPRDATAPLLLVGNVDGTSQVLIYNELLNEGSTPATTDFTVDIAGTDYTPSSVAVIGAVVTARLRLQSSPRPTSTGT